MPRVRLGHGRQPRQVGVPPAVWTVSHTTGIQPNELRRQHPVVQPEQAILCFQQAHLRCVTVASQLFRVSAIPTSFEVTQGHAERTVPPLDPAGVLRESGGEASFGLVVQQERAVSCIQPALPSSSTLQVTPTGIPPTPAHTRCATVVSSSPRGSARRQTASEVATSGQAERTFPPAVPAGVLRESKRVTSRQHSLPSSFTPRVTPTGTSPAHTRCATFVSLSPRGSANARLPLIQPGFILVCQLQSLRSLARCVTDGSSSSRGSAKCPTTFDATQFGQADRNVPYVEAPGSEGAPTFESVPQPLCAGRHMKPEQSAARKHVLSFILFLILSFLTIDVRAVSPKLTTYRSWRTSSKWSPEVPDPLRSATRSTCNGGA